MDATDPNNVKVVNEVCQLGIVHNEYGAMSVGNDFNIQGGEEYQHGTYNRAEGTIRIGVLICYADSQQLFVTPFNSTLYLNPERPETVFRPKISRKTLSQFPGKSGPPKTETPALFQAGVLLFGQKIVYLHSPKWDYN